MPIEALPANTVCAIGSTQALTDSNSVVKELVDNAIDANATAIFVEISANALDKIQVKDNGHGIALDDRKLVCKRYCTSKIRDLDDLRSLGGQPLGFRGEALASAFAMSGGLKLTTRVEGEGTAVEFTYDSQGKVTSEKHVSHPIGTTISVQDFLQTLPVRRQTAVKETMSTVQLVRIKRTLQAYALARPRIRLSLRVLKSKSEKSNWSYAPKKGLLEDDDISTIIQNAAAQVLGKSIINSCQWLFWKSIEACPHVKPALISNSDVDLRRTDFVFQALLPKSDCTVDFSSLNLPRQYLFVDSRPVSCARGTLKQIVSLFKKHFNAATSKDSKSKSMDPFLYLNIVCVGGAYDANVEPAKDDVLFEDPIGILDTAEKLFAYMYGELKTGNENHVHLSEDKRPNADLLLAKKREAPCPSPNNDEGSKVNHPIHTTVDATAVKPYDKPLVQAHCRSVQDLSPNLRSSPVALPPISERSMYNDNLDDLRDSEILCSGNASENSCDDQSQLDDLDHVTVSNPWTIAKFNACLRQPNGTPSKDAKLVCPVQQPTPKRQRGDAFMSPNVVSAGVLEGIEHVARQLPSPGLSSPPAFPYPLSARAKSKEGNGSRARPNATADDQQNRSLDAWMNTSHLSDIRDSRSRINGSEENNSDGVQRKSYRNDFVSAQSLARGTSLSDIPDASKGSFRKKAPKKQKPNTLNKPFISPVHDSERVWFETGQQHTVHRKRLQSSHTPRSPYETEALNLCEDQDSVLSTTPSSIRKPIHPDLALTLEYEARKQQATQAYKANIRRQALEAQKLPQNRAKNLSSSSQLSSCPSSSSPHNSRYLKAKAALQSSSLPAAPHSSVLTQGAISHPNYLRANLMPELPNRDESPLNSEAPSRKPNQRTQVAMFPLENVAEADSVRELVLPFAVSAAKIAEAVEEAMGWDSYVADADGGEGLGHADERVTEAWQRRVEGLVGREYKHKGESGGTVMAVDVAGAVARLREG